MKLLKRLLVVGAVLVGLTLAGFIGFIYLVSQVEEGHDDHDATVDDIVTGADGPVMLVEAWIDARRQAAEITRIKRLAASEIARDEVDRCLREAAASDGRYGLSFREADGHELRSYLISPKAKAGTDRLVFTCQTNIVNGTHQLVLERSDENGEWHDMATRLVP